jgi:AhpD family alkylhydroperoxidase
VPRATIRVENKIITATSLILGSSQQSAATCFGAATGVQWTNGQRALAHVGWESCLIDPRRDRVLETYARRKTGVPFPTVRYFIPVPWLARAIVDLHPEFGLLMHVDHHQMDILALVVSQENSCRFCYAAVRMLLWAQGMSEARIQQIERKLSQANLAPKTTAAIAFGRCQSRVGPQGAREARQILREAGRRVSIEAIMFLRACLGVWGGKKIALELVV